jgi:hypothetical protein
MEVLATLAGNITLSAVHLGELWLIERDTGSAKHIKFLS